MQYNIFQNDFYDDSPGFPWAFRLTIILGDPGTALEILGNAVKDVNLPDIERLVHTIFFNGASFEFPMRIKNSKTFSIVFNEDCKLRVYNSIKSLFNRSYDNRDVEVVDGKRNMYRRKYSDLSMPMTIVVDIIDPTDLNLRDTKIVERTNAAGENTISGLESNDMRIVETYRFSDCFVESIDNLELDYSSEELVEWTMTVHFNSMTTEYPHQKKLQVSGQTQRTELAYSSSYDDPQFEFDNSRQQEGYGKFKDGGFGGTGGGGNGAGGDNTGRGLGGTGMYGLGNSERAISERSSNDGISGGTSTEDTYPQKLDEVKHSYEPETSIDERIEIEGEGGTGSGGGSGSGTGKGSGKGKGESISIEKLETAFRYGHELAKKDAGYAQLESAIIQKWREGKLSKEESTDFERVYDTKSIRSLKSWQIVGE